MLDLHMHTVYSDGASQPEELVEACAQAGMKTISITDHDTTLSYDRAKVVADKLGVTLIPGIEINTHWKDPEDPKQRNWDLHVLGYFIDRENETLFAVTAKHKQARLDQMKIFAQKLAQATKTNMSFEDIKCCAHEDGVIGRPHVAQALLAKGAVSNISEAFQKYLSSHCDAYVYRETVSPHEAVEAIYEAGGIPVIAHPGDMPGIERITEELMNYGLCGLEAYHKSHSAGLIEFHCSLAEKYGLLVTGGTDFHGKPEYYQNTRRRLTMPVSILDAMHQNIANRSRRTFRVA